MVLFVFTKHRAERTKKQPQIERICVYMHRGVGKIGLTLAVDNICSSVEDQNYFEGCSFIFKVSIRPDYSGYLP